MRMLLPILGVVTFFSFGCMSTELEKRFVDRIDAIEVKLDSKEQAIAALEEALKSGAITQEYYVRELERLRTEIAANAKAGGDLEETYDDAKDAVVNEAVYSGAAIVSSGAEVLGPLADKILPGAGMLIGLLGQAAGGIAAGRRRNGAA